jgi:hypothetical protein
MITSPPCARAVFGIISSTNVSVLYTQSENWLVLHCALPPPDRAGQFRICRLLAGGRQVGSKWSAIRFYELQMAQWMKGGSLRLTAMWDYFGWVDAMQEISGLPTNPANDLWLTPLNMGFPFINIELLRLYPGSTPNLVVWHDAVRARARALQTYQ